MPGKIPHIDPGKIKVLEDPVVGDQTAECVGAARGKTFVRRLGRASAALLDGDL